MDLNALTYSIILIIIGSFCLAFGFLMLINFRKTWKILIGAIIFSLGILMYLLGIGIIAFKIKW